MQFEALFGFVRANQDTLPAGVMCRLLSVSRSGFYAQRERPLSARARRHVELMALIHLIHERSYDGTYGTPRIHMELRDTYGIRVGRKRALRAGSGEAELWGRST